MTRYPTTARRLFADTLALTIGDPRDAVMSTNNWRRNANLPTSGLGGGIRNSEIMNGENRPLGIG